jgi:hypothetical protein
MTLQFAPRVTRRPLAVVILVHPFLHSLELWWDLYPLAFAMSVKILALLAHSTQPALPA